MEYGDVDGVVTRREFKLKRAEQYSGNLYAICHCFYRGSERTFRVDRILSLSHTDLGTIADPVSHFSAFIDPATLPDPDHEAIMARVRPGLRALTWIARSDHELSEDEVQIILRFVDQRSKLAGPSRERTWNRDLARIEIENERSTFDSSAGALARISRTSREAALVREFATEISRLGGDSSAKRAQKLLKIIS
ncbi:WYL domain-containing protein [Microvirga zambiensis]|uniref:WYL domain-containing protein n=1 Tax=Microvirga zambiensis TaxID=1402137 RepID=UPI003CCDC548